VIETSRLILRRLHAGDDAFIVEMLGDPAFVRYVGDKGVRTRADARRYIETGPVDSYERFGFGPFLVELKATGAPIGLCGLRKREALPDPDLGYAVLPPFRRAGFAFEAAAGTLDHARRAWRLARIVAVTDPDNEASIALLRRLGFSFERMVRLAEGEPEVRLFASGSPAA
jgi:RimJ/RimL family protein N-acetyltransferase